MVTTFNSACAAAALDASVSIITGSLVLTDASRFLKAADGKNDEPAARIKAQTQTTGINQGANPHHLMTLRTGFSDCLASSFFSSFGAFL